MKPRVQLPLALTLGAIVIVIEIVVLFSLGGFYLRRFGAEVDRRLEETAARPGNLVANGALTTDSFGQRDTLESVVGPALDDAMIVTAEGVVLVALDPEDIGRQWDELDSLDPDWLGRAADGAFTEHVTSAEASFLASVAPIGMIAGEAPALFDYVRISTVESEREYANLRSRIIWGSIAAVVITTAALLVAIHRFVTRRIKTLASEMARLREGRYETDLATSNPRDEIGFLESGFVEMTDRLRSAFHSLERAVGDLRSAEEKYRTLVDNAAEAIFVVQDGNVVFSNPSGLRLMAQSEEETMLGQPIADSIHPDHRTRITENHIRRLKGESLPAEYDFKMLRTDGSWFWAELNVVLIEWKDRPATLNFISDITHRKQADAEMLAGTERARLQREALAGLLVRHPVTINALEPALERLTTTVAEAAGTERTSVWFLSKDHSELKCACLFERSGNRHSKGMVLKSCDHPGYFDALETETRIAADDAVEDPRTRGLADGHLRPLGIGSRLDAGIQVEGRLVGVLCIEHVGEPREWRIDEQAFAVMCGSIVAQILANNERRRAQQERQKLQTQLAQSQKMESVGRLAGGIAHDFNNMLQSILGNVGMAIEDTAPDHPAYESLTEIRDSARRSADLTRQLLTFARRQTVRPEIVNLDVKITGSVSMLSRLIGENIRLDWNPGTDPWKVEIDPSQLDQILTNLCVNARDAIKGAGTIEIATTNVTLTAGDLRGRDDAVPGDHVRLTVRDTGEGMDRETLANIFEPFFTTKVVGKGTGLGLATVFGIVRQNGGMIDVTSAPGEGSTFTIHLHRAEGESSGNETPEPHGRRDSGEGTILLVEDEDQVLRLGRRILSQRGYTVLAASNPLTAVEIARKKPDGIRLVVTDVIMPDMNGRELSERLRRLSPGIKTLFISGYTADIIDRHAIPVDGAGFLQKPFTNRELLDKVRSLLDPENRNEI